MSSHYIIRDDQEPALFLFESDAIKEEAVFSLLEWNPLVIISESAIGFIMNNSIKVDAVIIDKMSEEEVKLLLNTQYPFDIIIIDDLVTNLVEYLKFKGMHALDIVGKFGGTTIDIATKIQKEYPVSIFSGHVKYIHSIGTFRKWSSPGRGFTINCENENPLNTINLIKKDQGIYKVEQEGKIEITCECPIWIGEVLF